MKHLCWTYTALKSWLLKAPTGWVSRSLWVRNPTMPWPSAALSLFFITGLAAPTCRVLASTSLFLSNAHTTQNTVKEPAWLGFAYPPSQITYRKHTEISISGLWEHGRLISFDVCVCVCLWVPFCIFYNLNGILIPGAWTCFGLVYHIWPTTSPCSETLFPGLLPLVWHPYFDSALSSVSPISFSVLHFFFPL